VGCGTPADDEIAARSKNTSGSLPPACSGGCGGRHGAAAPPRVIEGPEILVVEAIKGDPRTCEIGDDCARKGSRTANMEVRIARDGHFMSTRARRHARFCRDRQPADRLALAPCSKCGCRPLGAGRPWREASVHGVICFTLKSSAC
jgi:hypothetical protein